MKKQKTIEPFVREVKLSAFFDKMPAAFRRSIKEIISDISEIKIVRVNSQFELKELDDKKQTMTAYASTRRLDHDGDIIMPMGCKTDIYKMNPVVLMAHDYQSLPIAKVLDITPDPYGVLEKIEFAPTERGQEAWQLVKGGFLNTLSAGFMADDVFYREDDEFTSLCDKFQREWPEFKGCDRDRVRRIVKSWTLFETSLCAVPANPYALVQDVAKGKIKLSDEMTKRLELEKYMKTTEHEPPIVPEPAPAIKPEPAKPATDIKEIAIIRPAIEKINIRQTLTESALSDMIEKIVTKVIAKRRGIIG